MENKIEGEFITSSEIEIKKAGDSWYASNSNRIIAHSMCRNCVVALMLRLTKTSKKYDKIVVYNEDGSLKVKILTGSRGEVNDRTSKEVS